jgi:thioester reductase-like protein
MLKKSHIFITGATGNVGGKLVPEILRRLPDSQLTLLVRGRSQKEAAERAMRTIVKLTPEFEPATAAERLRVVCGDIERPDLGLDAAEYDRLATGITHIIHSAAATKFVLPVDKARAVNFNGTQHVAGLGLRAARLGNRVQFGYVGTAFVCGNQSGIIPEAIVTKRPVFSNIYEQTKWEAEQYIHSVADDLPTAIFRPSIIVGDSRTGRINDFNVLYAPLRLIITGRVRVLPCRPGTPLDVVPLDYVAQSITRIFFGRAVHGGEIYQIVAGRNREATVGNVVDSAIQYINQRYPELTPARVRYIPAAAAGLGLTKRLGVGSRMASVMGAYLPYFTCERHFVRANTDAASGDGTAPPRFNEYMGNLMAYFLECDLRRRLRAAA